MSDTTARLGLPTIRAGQAQKESSHNEALTGLDLAVQASALAAGATVPPAGPVPGQAWVLGAAPVGAWSGHALHLAGWTEGGWRFVAPVDGMTVWLSEAAVFARYSGGAWSIGELRGERLVIGGQPVVGARGSAVAAPAGGGTIDAEARAAINAVLARLRAHGLIAS